jgi:ABC-type Fe3+/spermidine/putrescine transport system ATPase subunit
LRDRYPSQLSGGQRQRVALARAIICEPRLILLDEPLAALDVALRRQMQQFLKSIQREIRTTFLFVTHDQEEAITMSDRICVMDKGQILQTGSAQDLYYRPEGAFVAGFFGDNNLIEARIAEMSGSTAALDTAIGRLLAGTDDAGAVAAVAGALGFAMIRPEAISIAMENTGPGLDAVIDSVEFGGASTLVVARALAGDGTTKLRIRLASTAMGSSLAPGQAVRLHWSQGDCRLVLP